MNDIPSTQPKKKRHIFKWIFLAIQLLFVAWLISGIVGVSNNPCTGNMSKEACTAAKQIGGGIGFLLILFVWLVVDVILGVGYLIFRKR